MPTLTETETLQECRTNRLRIEPSLYQGLWSAQSYVGSGSTAATTWYADTTACTGSTLWIDYSSATCTASTHLWSWGGIAAACASEPEPRTEEERKKRDEANERAYKLLMTHLDEEQQAEYREKKRFQVRAPSGRVYEIRKGWAGNVKEIEDGEIVASYCIHPVSPIPVEDSLLAQKLLLETDEEEFLRIANRTSYRRELAAAA